MKDDEVRLSWEERKARVASITSYVIDGKAYKSLDDYHAEQQAKKVWDAWREDWDAIRARVLGEN